MADRPLDQAYRRFGEVESAQTSPLYRHVSVALGESAEAMRVIEALPASKRRPAFILATLHDLVLAGQAPGLAAAYATGDGDAAAPAAVDALLSLSDLVIDLAVHRSMRTVETGYGAVLYPAIAEAAHRAGASTLGLVDLGHRAGFNLYVDQAGITYSDGLVLGDPSGPVQLRASVVGDRSIPTRAMPEVVARTNIDRDPVDITEANETRWLRACLLPGHPERTAMLDAELALAARNPPVLLRGDAIKLLSDAIARVPEDALPVVITTWALSNVSPSRRPAFLHRLEEAATSRPVAWVSAEGVGVAPAIPTLGDRPASGHSIIGLATFDRSGVRAQAIGRCWSRGRLLSWLVAS